MAFNWNMSWFEILLVTIAVLYAITKLLSLFGKNAPQSRAQRFSKLPPAEQFDITCRIYSIDKEGELIQSLIPIIEKRQMVEAIKMLRMATKMSLVEAKDVVTYLQAELTKKKS